ncbi:DNA repair protein REV1 [Cryptococcus neoformans c45]|nr:DNA repair protein REV1 [Cryptococcus neoformans var. grubii c45]
MPENKPAGKDPDPSSSFPISSPSFWAEAATISIPPVDHKRPRSSPAEANTGEASSRVQDNSPLSKRPRTSTKSPDHGLTFLPNPQDIDPDDPQAYLANPEYAPNRFGDIGDYMRKKEIKVQAQNASIAASAASGILPQIFTGLSFYINGNTQPSMEQLRKLLLQRGGTVYPVLRNKTMVDYIIAPVLTLKKHEEFKRHKVVKEGWVVESCQQDKLLDWRKWRLQPDGGRTGMGTKGLESFFAQGSKAKQDFGGPTEELSNDPIDTKLAAPVDEDTERNTPSDVINVTPTKPIPMQLQRLLTPRKQPHAPIPISPGQPPPSPTSPAPVSPKIQKPEGAWEHYYKKESNEHAAKALQSDTWRAQNTAEQGNAGGFIDGYYQNSRLHHLSTWKAELKVLVRDAQKRSEEALAKATVKELAEGGEERDQAVHSLAKSVLPSIPLPAVPSDSANRVIFHVDFDAFFVSCGLATRPYLKGKPTVVCHSSGKGAGSTSEIASCSYEAREKGVRNGMSLGRASELVGPDLRTMPYEFETYKRFSLAFYTVLMAYADELQAVSVDEALIDVTGHVAARAALPQETAVGEKGEERDPAVELAEKIRDDVRKVTDGCEVSIGIAHNILLAKLATRHAKPAGVYHLISEAIPSFIHRLSVEEFPSVGYSTKSKIEAAFKTTKAGELLDISKGRWKSVLGEKTGEMMWGYLRGIDLRKLEGDKIRKSVSAEMNYGIRFQTQGQAEQYVRDLAAEVSKRMKNVGVKGRQITLKLLKRHPDAPVEPPKFLGHGWCETYNRSSTLSTPGGGPTDDPKVLGTEGVKLLGAMSVDPVELRGVGIQVTKLDTEGTGRGQVDRPTGQRTLNFVKQSKNDTEPVAGPSRLPAQAQNIEKDGLDAEFLAALPPSLASEVCRDHALNNFDATKPIAVQPSRTPPLEIISIPSSSPPAKVESPRSLRPPSPQADTSPEKATPKLRGPNEAAHIARQLRPKTKVQMKAGMVAEGPLFGAWSKARDKTVEVELDKTRYQKSTIVDLTNTSPPQGTGADIKAELDEDQIVPGYTLAYLRSLGIDPDVLLALPEAMRKEVIVQEEENARRRQALFQPGGRSRSRGTSTSVSPVKLGVVGGYRGRSTSRSVPPQQRQNVKIIKPPKPALMNSTELPDVLRTIELWIESREDSPPADKDATKVAAFLKKCLNDGEGKVGDGVEKVVEVLRWMRVILKEKWAQDEGLNENASEAGREWWRIWRQMRDEVNLICVKKFGAGLRI